MSANSEVRVVRTFEELDSLEREWAALSERFQSPLLDHDWFTCAARAFHREKDLRVFTLRQGGVLAAVAPMALDAANRHLVLLGSTKLFEPSGWLYASDGVLHDLTKAVLAAGPVAVLDRIESSSPILGALHELRWRGVPILRKTADALFLPTSDQKLMSSRARRKIETLRTNAERECGDVRIVRTSPQRQEALTALELFATVEGSGWKGRQGSSLSKRADLSSFFRDYVLRAAEKQRLTVTALWIGDTPAAVEVGVEAYRRMWCLKLAYDERFAKYGPAVQVVHASIAAAGQAGLDAYEFLGSAESWQIRWHPTQRQYRSAAVYPLSGQAMATAMRDATSFVSRRLQRQAKTADGMA